MATKGRRLELTCTICGEPLTSTRTALTEDVLAIIAEQNVLRKTLTDHSEYTRYSDIDKDQVVATKCGHMFHMGCLRAHVKNALDKKGTIFCPICTRPVTLNRVWPVLIPPTPCQAARFKKMTSIKDQNADLQSDLQEMRLAVKQKEKELKKIQEETAKCLDDIQRKQRQLDELSGPGDEELEELRKIHTERQAIVRVVTKHNAELLEVLMHETNLQLSDFEDEEHEDDKLQDAPETPVQPTHCTNISSIRYFDKRYAQSTDFGVPSDSFQEMNDLSSATFSERSAIPSVIPSKPKQMPAWETAKEIFHKVKGAQRIPSKDKSGKKVQQTSVNVVNLTLGRKEGTRRMCKKETVNSVNTSSKKKKVQLSKYKPDWL